MNRNQMKSLLEEHSCPICFELMNSVTENASPKTLHCSHTLCKGCLSDLHSEGSVTCPQCRNVTSSPLERIATNFTMVNTIETLKISFDAVSAKYVACGNCEEKRGSLHCLDCSVIFCDTCTAAHGVMKPFKAHKVVPMKTLDLKKPYCPLHESEATLYCEGCLKFICMDCKASHVDKPHNVGTIEEIYAKSLAEIRARVSQRMVHLNKNNEVVVDLQNLLQELPVQHQKWIDAVEQNFDSEPLLRILSERKEVALQCIANEIVEPSKQSITERLQEYETGGEKLEKCILQTEENITKKSASDLIKSQSSMITELFQCRLPDHPKQLPLTTVGVDFNMSQVKNSLATLCKTNNKLTFSGDISKYSTNKMSPQLVLAGTVVCFVMKRPYEQNEHFYTVTSESSDRLHEFTGITKDTTQEYSKQNSSLNINRSCLIKGDFVDLCLRLQERYVVVASPKNHMNQPTFKPSEDVTKLFKSLSSSYSFPSVNTVLLCYEYADKQL